jgi:hypothetical protein
METLEDEDGTLWAIQEATPTPWENEPNPEIVESNFGFVYRLTLPDGRWYIGKKTFWADRKTKKACRTKGKIVEKGKKKTVRVRTETDWKNYFSSGWEIAAWIERSGIEGIRREVLEITPRTGKDGKAGAGYLAYRELCWQLHLRCLEDPECLNGIINVRLSRAAIGIGPVGRREPLSRPRHSLRDRQ